MFKAIGSFFAFIISLFSSLDDATVLLDNMLDETLVSSELSKVAKFNEYQEARDKLKITDDEVDALALRLRSRKR